MRHVLRNILFGLWLTISGIETGAANTETPVPIGSEFQINNEVAGAQKNPSITNLANGGFVIIWDSIGPGYHASVHGKMYDSAGLPSGEEFLVSDHTQSSKWDTSVAGLYGGGFVVIWCSSIRTEEMYSDVYAQLYSASGSRIGEAFQVSTNRDRSQCTPSVAATANGGFVVVWSSFYPDERPAGDIFGQRYNASGAPIGNEFRVNINTSDHHQQPTATGLSDGGFIVVWSRSFHNGTGHAISAQRYTSTGSQFGAEFFVDVTTEYSNFFPSIAELKDGGFIIIWQSKSSFDIDRNMYGRRYSATGEEIKGKFIIDNFYADYNDSDVKASNLSDGSFIVTWRSYQYQEIGQNCSAEHRGYGKRFGSDGETIGNRFYISNYCYGPTYYPDTTGLSGGDFVVVWAAEADQENGSDIYGQRYTLKPWQISPLTPTFDESADQQTFTISRARGAGAQTVYISTTVTEGYANVGDYVGIKNQALTFADGETSKTINVSIIDDGEPEPDETFGLIVQENPDDPVDTYLAKTTFTIRNDDMAPTSWSITPEVSSIKENRRKLKFSISRPDTNSAQSVYVSTVQTEGFYNGNDYAPFANHLLVFSKGQRTKTLSLIIENDRFKEPDETFGLIVQKKPTHSISRYLAKATFTIINEDDVPVGDWSVKTKKKLVQESEGRLKFTVKRSDIGNRRVVYVYPVALKVPNINDFIFKPIKLTFKKSVIKISKFIEIISDSTKERKEKFGIAVSDKLSDSPSPPLAQTEFVIGDDDRSWRINLSSSKIREDEGNLTFTVQRPKSRLGKRERAFISTIWGSSDKNFDYKGFKNQNYDFSKNERVSKEFKVKIIDDTKPELKETYQIVVQENACDDYRTNFHDKKSFTIIDDDGGNGPVELDSYGTDSRSHGRLESRRAVSTNPDQSADEVSDGFRHPLGTGYLTEDLTTSMLDAPMDEGDWFSPVDEHWYRGFHVPCGANFKEFVLYDKWDASQDKENGEGSFHFGEDWNGSPGGIQDEGIPVYSISNGVVVHVNTNECMPLGKFVVIRHKLPYKISWNSQTGIEYIYSLYSHLSDTVVEKNDTVFKGRDIGTLGNTGGCDRRPSSGQGISSTGPHLHFEVFFSEPCPSKPCPAKLSSFPYKEGDDWDGYNPNKDDRAWDYVVDPTDFINAHRRF